MFLIYDALFVKGKTFLKLAWISTLELHSNFENGPASKQDKLKGYLGFDCLLKGARNDLPF